MSSKGKLLLYVQIKKVMYGLLCSSILFYRNTEKYIESYGFHINSYDLCVSNKMINDKQMREVCYVADLKVSHINSFETTKFEGYLSSNY